MKEYCIYIRQGDGKPYILQTFKDIDLAKIKLYEMISFEEERQKPYFVDNDFYNNKYNISTKLKYICIKEREVTEWKKYSTKEDMKKGNNIINIMEYKIKNYK